jgi:hypothetical protein
MDKVKSIVNHPLSKSIALCIIGSLLLLEGHSLYSGVAIGVGLREMLLAFKEE